MRTSTQSGPGTKGELGTCPLLPAGSRGRLPRPLVHSAIPLEILERRGQTREPLPKAHFPKSAPEDQHRASPLPGPFSEAVPPTDRGRHFKQFGRRRWTLNPGLGLWPLQPLGSSSFCFSPSLPPPDPPDVVGVLLGKCRRRQVAWWPAACRVLGDRMAVQAEGWGRSIELGLGAHDRPWLFNY